MKKVVLVTRNGEHFVTFDNLHIGNSGSIYTIVGNREIVLGNYQTKERAYKVIVKIIKDIQNIQHGLYGENPYTMYYMPYDDIEDELL